MKSNPGVAATMFETLADGGHQHRDDLDLGHPHLVRRAPRPQVEHAVQVLHTAFGLDV